mmetsp:Transcript_46830/g.82558  ORF Transcript_46830/g.82558 Transcript_46830/m.82558 type:complete len:225 (-) Transcript_46830:893-1567(-)
MQWMERMERMGRKEKMEGMERSTNIANARRSPKMGKSPRSTKLQRNPRRKRTQKSQRRRKIQKILRIPRLLQLHQHQSPKQTRCLGRRASRALVTLLRCKNGSQTRGTSSGCLSSRQSRTGLRMRKREEVAVLRLTVRPTTRNTTLLRPGKSLVLQRSFGARAVSARACSPACSSAGKPLRIKAMPSSLCAQTTCSGKRQKRRLRCIDDSRRRLLARTMRLRSI